MYSEDDIICIKTVKAKKPLSAFKKKLIIAVCFAFVFAIATAGTLTAGFYIGRQYPNEKLSQPSLDGVQSELKDNSITGDIFSAPKDETPSSGNDDASEQAPSNGGSASQNDESTQNSYVKTELPTASFSSNNGSLSQSLDVSDIAEGIMPCMVAITNISVQEVNYYFGMYGYNRNQQTESSGSGIIVGQNETELLIVTNNHVIEDSTTLSVCFVDNNAVKALLKGSSPDYDLAVIAVKLSDIPAETMNAIAAAPFGESSALKVGQQVVAIGNALGYGQSVTTGIVSALNRQVSGNNAVMLQTDAAINPGNSGGALVNMQGEVIGINSAKYSSTDVEGMGYAIAISEARELIEELLNRETKEKVPEEQASYLGISAQEVTAETEAYYGIPQGVYINGIVRNSAAHLAGLNAKTVITHINGTRVTSISNLKSQLEYYASGETVTLTVQIQNGNSYIEQTVDVTLDSKPSRVTNGTF